MPLSQASRTTGCSQAETLVAIARIRLALSAISIALTITGCSSYATPNQSVSTRDKSILNSSTSPVTYRQSSGTHEPHRTLLASGSAPNCELAALKSDTIDEDLWARLKLDYERHCYKQAEMLARKRLRQLLASGQCRDTALSRWPAFRHNYATVR
jgi:hypothetical protein